MITLDELNASLHSVAISDGSNDLAIDSNGYLTINAAGGSFAVTATDLDIRALTNSDVVTAEQGGAWNIGTVASITADVSIDDGGNSITIDDGGASLTVDGAVTVSATDLDIRGLNVGTDGDHLYLMNSAGSNSMAVNADGSLNVQSAPSGLDVWQTSSLSATSTAAEIAATPLPSRLRMLIQNTGSQDVFLGPENSVTTSTGIKIPKGSSFEFPFGASANIWAITASGTAELNISEHAN